MKVKVTTHTTTSLVETPTGMFLREEFKSETTHRVTWYNTLKTSKITGKPVEVCKTLSNSLEKQFSKQK